MKMLLRWVSIMVGKAAVVAVANGQGQAGPAFAFLAQTLVNEHVGVHRHAEHEHQAGQAGQREGRLHGDHEADGQNQVGQQGHAGHDAGEAVVDDHEEQHGREGQAIPRGRRLDRVLAERRAHGALAHGLRLQGWRAGTGPENVDELIDLALR